MKPIAFIPHLARLAVIAAAFFMQGCSLLSQAPQADNGSFLIDSVESNIPESGVKPAVHTSATSPAIKTIGTGKASWYGPGFRGKKTASGDIFDDARLTAAHKSLPLGSKAMVTNLSNGKSVEVEINDRGPFIQGRVIDLSRAAARALGMVDRGVVPVRVDVVKVPGEELVIAE
jgi:rare lipoprotein A (peptidoglycan hydrolase)